MFAKVRSHGGHKIQSVRVELMNTSKMIIFLCKDNKCGISGIIKTAIKSKFVSRHNFFAAPLVTVSVAPERNVFSHRVPLVFQLEESERGIKEFIQTKIWRH